jgi:hypothetical protein
MKVPNILQEEGINAAVTNRGIKSEILGELAIAGDRYAHLFDL